MSCRLLIPKNGGVYFLYFLAALGALAGMLYLYYVPPEMGGEVSEESLAFLDVTRSTSLFQWFVSIIWLGIAALAFLLVFFSGSLRGGGLKSLFWLSVGSVALVMSADAVCGFLPTLRIFAEQKIAEFSGDSADASLTLWILGVIALVFVFSESCFLWRYIRSVSYGSRLLLKGLFLIVTLTFGLSVAFHYALPSDGSVAAGPRMMARSAGGASSTERTSKSTPPAKSAEKAEGSEASEEPGTETEPPSDTEQEDAFRYVSYEKESKEATNKEALGKDTVAEDTATEDTDTEDTDTEDTDTEDTDTEDTSGEKAHEGEEKSESDEEVTAGSAALPAKSTSSDTIEVWEDLFGWEHSLEENLGLQMSVEEIFGLDGTFENALFGGAKLDALKTREILRKGMYGLFLIFLSTGLGVLARAERVSFDKQIFRGNYQIMNNPDLGLTSDL